MEPEGIGVSIACKTSLGCRLAPTAMGAIDKAGGFAGEEAAVTKATQRTTMTKVIVESRRQNTGQ